jgi:hypothetical protein
MRESVSKILDVLEHHYHPNDPWLEEIISLHSDRIRSREMANGKGWSGTFKRGDVALIAKAYYEAKKREDQ